MKGRNRRRRSVWLRLTFAVAMGLVVHALTGSAQAAPAGDVSATPGIVLAGLSSQQFPAFFRISANDRVLLAGEIAIGATCTDGSNFVVPDLALRVPIGAGTWRLRVQVTGPGGESIQCDSGPVRFTATR